MEKEYAHAVMQLAQKGMEPRALVANLNRVLGIRGHSGLLRKIARALKEEERHARRASEVVLSVAKEEEAKLAEAAARTYSSSAPSRVVPDDSLIGGWVLMTPSTRVDASFKKQLLEMYRQITA